MARNAPSGDQASTLQPERAGTVGGLGGPHEQAPADESHEGDGQGRHGRPRLPLTDDRSWDVQDVAYFLHVSESTVRNLERDRELPALPRIGARVTFDPKVVWAFRDGWRPASGGRASGSPAMFDPRPASHRQGR